MKNLQNTNMIYTHRYIARVILKAETPLLVGSGKESLLKDALVQKDHNGFPMIQGTSLTGVLRHSLEDNGKKDLWKSFFGYQKEDKGEGSQVKISSAYFLFPNDKVAEGMTKLEEAHKAYLSYFENLPSRQHVRITHRGVAASEDGGLFENEVVYKGCRFIFEIELKGNPITNPSETTQWNVLLNQLAHPLFRLGQGTRNGYGQLSVESCKAKVFDLNQQGDFDAYLEFNTSLNASNSSLASFASKSNATGLDHYKLSLQPESFFIFGSGYGDMEVDNIPNTEQVLSYQEGQLKFEDFTLIPASSIKGAISHRTCFHYNKLKKIWADKEDDLGNHIGINNEGVYQLFGAESGVKTRAGSRGKVILNDLYYKEINNDKILNHVSIDRFTGGAIDGALFSEKVSYKEDKIEIDIWVEQVGIEDTTKKALTLALQDVCSGLLPLGGMVTKGHGIFTGSLLLNNETIYQYE